MAGDQHVDEVGLPREAGQRVRSKVGPPIRNEKLQLGREKGP